jgi:hypothetical protein
LVMDGNSLSSLMKGANESQQPIAGDISS